VRDLHEGSPAASARELYDRTRGRRGTLLGVSFRYAIGVLIGLVLLVVPGLILLARWALIVPLVMIERLGWAEAFNRSSTLVRGHTGRVLLIILVSDVITIALSFGIVAAFLSLPRFAGTLLGSTIAGAVTVPFQAHVLTVLYYRLTEPDRPVLPGLT
jgi:hypothetical protein